MLWAHKSAVPGSRFRFSRDAKLVSLIRHQLAIFLLIGIALVSAGSVLLDVFKAYSSNPAAGQTAVFQARFEEMRKALPPHGVVGYITDAAPDEATRSLEYFLTQYALAPVVVVDDPNQALVVSNFHTARAANDLLSEKHLVLVRDFSNGVLLLRSSPQ